MEHVDGRASRWDAHRIERRRELVESTLRAIRRNGATLTIDDIAREARTSKTVIYRHFGDRTGLYLAVVERVADNILGDLLPTLAASSDRELHALVRELVDAYTRLVERDPEIYRFVLNRPSVDLPSGDDPIQGVTERIAGAISATIAVHLRWNGRADAPAAMLAHGLVGFVRAATNHWMTEGLTSGSRRPREAVVAEVSSLFGPALVSTVLAKPAADPSAPTPPFHHLVTAD